MGVDRESQSKIRGVETRQDEEMNVGTKIPPME